MGHDKIALITGGTEGIGKATALGLAQKGYTVIIHGRNERKARVTQQEIIQATGNKNVDIVFADFSSLKEVKELAIFIESKYPHIDVLINNAGVFTSERALSKDGFELTLAVNHLAHFLLTNLLLDTLKKASAARIVVLTSSLYTGGKPDWNDFQFTKKFDSFGVYNTTKLYNLYFALELSERLKNTSITVNALHPGVVSTQLARDTKGFQKFLFSILTKYVFVSPEKGAATSLYVATSPELEKVTGKYFESQKQVPIKGIGNDVNNRSQLWKISKDLIKGFLPVTV